jgi:hypothetical protein
MGLDQYLTAKKYVARWEYSNGYQDREQTQDFIDLLPMDAPDITEHGGHSGITIEYPVGYWRKANAIHGWFVQQIGQDVDDCREMYISRDKLKDLRNSAQKVLYAKDTAAVAEREGLEPTKGFFFGTYDYDEWYIEDLKRTVDICNKALKLPEEYSVHYQASW